MKRNEISIKSTSNGKQIKKKVKTTIKSETAKKITIDIEGDVDAMRLFMDWLDSVDVVEVKKVVSTKMT